MRLKLDENLPPIAAVRISDAGYDACTVHDQGLQGTDDLDLAKICHAENRAMVTLDRGFANLRRYPPEAFSGIVVLRPQNQLLASILGVVDRLIHALDQAAASSDLALTGRLWVVEPQRLRVRGYR